MPVHVRVISFHTSAMIHFVFEVVVCACDRQTECNTYAFSYGSLDGHNNVMMIKCNFGMKLINFRHVVVVYQRQ